MRRIILITLGFIGCSDNVLDQQEKVEISNVVQIDEGVLEKDSGAVLGALVSHLSNREKVDSIALSPRAINPKEVRNSLLFHEEELRRIFRISPKEMLGKIRIGEMKKDYFNEGCVKIVSEDKGHVAELALSMPVFFEGGRAAIISIETLGKSNGSRVYFLKNEFDGWSVEKDKILSVF